MKRFILTSLLLFCAGVSQSAFAEASDDSSDGSFDEVDEIDEALEAEDAPPKKKEKWFHVRLNTHVDMSFDFQYDEEGMNIFTRYTEMARYMEVAPAVMIHNWIIRGSAGRLTTEELDNYTAYGLGVGHSTKIGEKLRIEPGIDMKMVYTFPVVSPSVTGRFLIWKGLDAHLRLGLTFAGDALVFNPKVGMGLAYTH